MKYWIRLISIVSIGVQINISSLTLSLAVLEIEEIMDGIIVDTSSKQQQKTKHA